MLTLSIAAIVGLPSCSEDVALDSSLNEGEVNVVMSASLPEGLTTYGLTSSEGGLKNLEGKGLSVRYIMEVYPKGSEEKVVRMIKYADIVNGNPYRTTSFETRLLAAEYNFVFYADIVKKINAYPYGVEITGITAPYYGNRYFFSNTKEVSTDDNIDEVLIRPTAGNTSEPGDLKTIIASRSSHSTFEHLNPEQYDIYTCTQSVDLRRETSNNFTLKRPFAKLRLVTTDVDELVSTPDWSKTVVTISPDASTPINNTFNALTGTTSSTDKGYWVSSMQAQSSDVYEDETSNEKTLFVFYLPVVNGSHNLSFEITAKSGNTTLVDNAVIEVMGVPLAENKLTTIKGKLLTKKTVSSITIDDEFIKDEDGEVDDTEVPYGKEASTAEELVRILSGESESITYTGPVTRATGLTIDFDKATRSANVYKEDNTAELTLHFTNMEEGSVITILGKTNAPKTIVLDTPVKCSIRVNSPNSKILLSGEAYKYLVYNCFIDFNTSTEPSVDAFLISEGSVTTSYFFPLNEDFDTLYLDEQYNLKKECDVHIGSNGCDLVNKIKQYTQNNAGKTVWDFVEANK